MTRATSAAMVGVLAVLLFGILFTSGAGMLPIVGVLVLGGVAASLLFFQGAGGGDPDKLRQEVQQLRRRLGEAQGQARGVADAGTSRARLVRTEAQIEEMRSDLAKAQLEAEQLRKERGTAGGAPAPASEPSQEIEAALQQSRAEAERLRADVTRWEGQAREREEKVKAAEARAKAAEDKAKAAEDKARGAEAQLVQGRAEVEKLRGDVERLRAAPAVAVASAAAPAAAVAPPPAAPAARPAPAPAAPAPPPPAPAAPRPAPAPAAPAPPPPPRAPAPAPAPAAPAPAAPARPPAAAPGGRTLLLVDDDEPFRTGTAEILREGGYEVLVAADGPSALAEVERHKGRIDLLVTDMVMPGMNGRVLAQRFTAARPGVRVLYVSGYVDEASAREAISGEDADFLEKPFEPDALFAKITQLIAR